MSDAFIINATGGGNIDNGFAFQDIIIQGAGFTDGIGVDRLPLNGDLLINRVNIANTSGDGIDISPGVSNVEIDIQSSILRSNGTNGIHLRGSGDDDSDVTIIGNQITGSGTAGINYNDFDAPIDIRSNRIGITSQNSTSSNNRGIWINASSSDEASQISGNIISGNSGQAASAGVLLQGSQYPNLLITNNGIGTTLNGGFVDGLGNGDGISLFAGSTIGQISENTIADSEDDGIFLSNSNGGDILENLIVASGGDGIDFSAGSDDWLVELNDIGSLDTAVLGNSGKGVRLGAGSTGNTLNSNFFGRNGQGGISLEGSNSTGNRFSANRYTSNSGLPIDLNNDGPTDNDNDDLDSGPNALLNTPVFTGSILSDGANYSVNLQVDVDSAGSYIIEFYRFTDTGVGSGEYQFLSEFPFSISNIVSDDVEASPSVDIPVSLIDDGDQIAVLLRGTSGVNVGNTSEISMLSGPAGRLLGDYSGDGIVDAADYTVWRDSYEESVPPFSGADGDGDGVIGRRDYDIWVTYYGATTNSPVPPSPGGIAVAPGDYNGDGVVDYGDYLVWESTLGSTTDLRADGNNSGQVDLNDLGIWQVTNGLTTLPELQGDFNGDLIVNADDLLLWQAGDLAADANGDGQVDQADMDVWQANEGLVHASAWPEVFYLRRNTSGSVVGAPRVLGLSVANASGETFDFAGVAGSGEQLRSLSIAAPNRVSIQFNEQVLITQHALLLDNLDGSAPAIADFEYDSGANTATWTFDAPLEDGRTLVRLSDSLADLDGELLDGEFANPWTLADTSTTPLTTGDGEAGGQFRFRFTVLENDADRDNVDGATDYTNWHSIEPGAIYVSTTADEFDGDLSFGDVSLREAVDYANNAAEPFLITLPTGDYQLTREGAESGIDVAYNDLDVVGDVTIVGAGAGLSVIRGYDAAFAAALEHKPILAVVGSGAGLRLSGVTLTGTEGAASYGGAIRVTDGARLLLTESAVTSHNSPNVGVGVGVLSAGGDVTIRRSVFTANAGIAATAVYAVSAPSHDGSLTIGESIFALNASHYTPAVYVNPGPTAVTNEGSNLYDEAGGGFFDVAPNATDHLGTPTYVVSSVADTFDAGHFVANPYALSLREAVHLSNESAGADEIWLPAWQFELTRDRASYGGGSTTDTDVAFGDLDISDTLTVRGVTGKTSVAWKAGVVDEVFDLLGNYSTSGASANVVDGMDLSIWQIANNYNLTSFGDGDEDGDIDQDDYDLWFENLGNSIDLVDVTT